MPVGAAPGTLPAFDRLQNMWVGIEDYSMTIDSHEVLGDQSAENLLHYAYKRPDHARLDIVGGNRSGSTIVWQGGEKVLAYWRRLSLFKLHGDARDKNLTSLRGNGILGANMGDVIACFAANRDLLREHDGPDIDGKATDEIELPYQNVSCPDDPPSDRGVVTLDVLDLDKQTGLALTRRRYQGDQVVERWDLSDYRINTGLGDQDLR
jgi:hypothetical protein